MLIDFLTVYLILSLHKIFIFTLSSIHFCRFCRQHSHNLSRVWQTMGAMNKQMDQAGIQETMQAFQRENMKMDMTDEMMNDTLDSVFGDDDVEEESDAIMHQVLDVIGLDISAQV